MRRTTLTLLLVLVLTILGVMPAMGAGRVPTVVRIDAPKAADWGERVVVTARLSLADGTRVPDMHVSLQIGSSVRGGRTNARGIASFNFRPPEKPGRYRIKVIFNGSSALLPSSDTDTLVVKPRMFSVQTVPPMEGASFILDGRTFAAGPDGLAAIRVANDFDDARRPTPLDVDLGDGVSARFSKWRTKAGQVVAAYDLFYDVGVSFIDANGHAVDPSLVTTVKLKSSIGHEFEIQGGETFNVVGSRVVPLAGGLQVKDITYAVQEVVIDGANVVHRNQQRFTPRSQRTWPIEVLFYRADIIARDAIFGFPIGTSVTITYPDGHTRTVPLRDGRADLAGLPRGEYQVQSSGGGISFVRPIALSRDQEVELKVISYLDIFAVAALGVIVLVGLFLWGRPGAAHATRRFLGRRRFGPGPVTTLAPVPLGAAAGSLGQRGSLDTQGSESSPERSTASTGSPLAAAAAWVSSRAIIARRTIEGPGASTGPQAGPSWPEPMASAAFLLPTPGATVSLPDATRPFEPATAPDPAGGRPSTVPPVKEPKVPAPRKAKVVARPIPGTGTPAAGATPGGADVAPKRSAAARSVAAVPLPTKPVAKRPKAPQPATTEPPPAPVAVVRRLPEGAAKPAPTSQRKRRASMGIDPLEMPSSTRSLDRAVGQVVDDLVDRRNGKS